LSIVLFVLTSLFFCPLYCLSFRPFYFVHCIVCPSVPFLLSIVLSVLRFTTSDYPFGIFWPLILYCLSFVDLALLITPLVSSDYPFGIFWLPLWYLLVTPFGIFKLF
jgi:CBS-domain-containing membrane protein